MHSDELWQVYAQNGQTLTGYGAVEDDFVANPQLEMGNAHVWCWKRTPNGISILIQKRSLLKKNSPGYYHASASGHVNVGESPVEAAVRESKEEINLSLNPSYLTLVQVVRPRSWQSFNYVYTYELSRDESFTFTDGEVDSVKWVPIDELKQMANSPEEYHLINQGAAYFERLFEAIERNV